jgi:hypothetical protein
MRPELRIEFEKKASVITPEVTVKALTVEGEPGNVNGVIKLKADGAESMMISVAGWRDVLSCRPSTSPVTVPGVGPNMLGMEKLKLSACPGVDASANAHANAPKVIFFMTRSLVD